MKTAACPKCANRELYVVDEALIPNYEYKNAIEPLTLTAHFGPNPEAAGASMRVPVRIEAYVCTKCAYTELYAKDLEVLARFTVPGTSA